MIRCLSVLVLALVCVTVTSAFQDKIDASKIVGKWEPDAKDAPPGAKIVMEMTKDNKLTVNAEFNGQKINMAGTYKVEGDKLIVKMKPPGSEEEKTSTMTIVKLTDDELVTKEGEKKAETLKRIK
jgi:uncharacterized protein (TIGR03066 family)